MLKLNPPSASFVNPNVDTLCDHVNEIPLQSDQEAAAEDLKVSPLSSLTLEPPSPMDSFGEDDIVYSDEECKTPRGETYKIPEITTCPPAPKRPKNMINLLFEGFTVKPKLDSSSEMEELLKKRDADILIEPSEIKWETINGVTLILIVLLNDYLMHKI